MRNSSMAVLVSLALTSCMRTSWPVEADSSAISDTPDHFMVVEAAAGTTSEPAGPPCRNPMTDPRDGTRLTLIRSSAGFGDYRPDKPRYGLSANQLLRVNCSDGRPIGATSAAP